MNTKVSIGWLVATLLLGFIAGRYRGDTPPGPPADVVPMKTVALDDMRLRDFHAADVPVEQFVRLLSARLGIDIDADTYALDSMKLGDAKVSVDVTDEPLNAVLARVKLNGKPMPLALYRPDTIQPLQDQLWLLGPVAFDSESKPVTRIYDISPQLGWLLTKWRRPIGPTNTTSRRPPSVGSGIWNDDEEEGPTREEAVEFITAMIEDDIDADTWKDNGGTVGSMRELGGFLTVTTTRRTHRAIAALLRRFNDRDLVDRATLQEGR